MNKFIISAIVCAGGLSKRMGNTNKVLLPYKNKVILSHVVEELLESNVSEVIVVLGHEIEKTKIALDHLGKSIKVIFNESYRTGQTSSIKAGLSALDPQSEAFMICLADMPLLSAHHINDLLKFYDQKSRNQKHLIVRPMVNQIPGHPVIMNHLYRQNIIECIDKEGCRSVISASKSSFIPYNTQDQAFIIDIDTPGIYEELLSNFSQK